MYVRARNNTGFFVVFKVCSTYISQDLREIDAAMHARLARSLAPSMHSLGAFQNCLPDTRQPDYGRIGRPTDHTSLSLQAPSARLGSLSVARKEGRKEGRKGKWRLAARRNVSCIVRASSKFPILLQRPRPSASVCFWPAGRRRKKGPPPLASPPSRPPLWT